MQHKLTSGKNLQVPEYKAFLVSVSVLIQKQHELFHKKTKSVLTLRSKESFRLIKTGKLFFLPFENESNHFFSWHKRLENLNFRDVANTKSEAYPASDYCEACVPGKILKKPFPIASNYKATQKLERVYSDNIGPEMSSSIGGNRYFINFIDEISSYAVIKLMNYKTSIASFERVCCTIWPTKNLTN